LTCTSVRCTLLYVAPDPKTERFMIRMDEEERKMLTELSDADGVSEATVVRQLLRKAHAERFRGKPPKKSKR
jgi:hypothetical protein